MTIHVRSVKIEMSKKALRKRKMREIRKMALKYGFILGVVGVGYSIAHGGFQDQVAAVKKMTSSAIETVKEPVANTKKTARLYEDKVNANKAAYDASLE